MSEIGLFAAVGGAFVSKEVVEKLLGPTAEWCGIGLQKAVQRAATNTARIIGIACEKVGSGLNAPGGVGARVLKSVVEESQFVEDAFAAEYFGGILAAARSTDVDDSMLPHLQAVKSLSSAQLRLHFLIYALLAKFPFPPAAMRSQFSFEGLRVRVDLEELLRGMQVNASEAFLIEEMLEELIAVGMLDKEWHSASSKTRATRQVVPNFGQYLVVSPNRRGASLFLKALGLAKLGPEMICNVEIDQRLSTDMRAEVCLPTDYRCYRVSRRDPLSDLRTDLESRLDDVEMGVDDLKTSVDEVNHELRANTKSNEVGI